MMLTNKKRLLIIPCSNNMNFLADIAEALKERFGVEVYDGERVRFEASYVWLEWLDGINISLLKDEHPILKNDLKVILRIHRYELFQERTLSEIAKINPDIIDKLIFVSDYMKQIGVSRFPWMEKGKVVPNLIDHTKFPFVDKNPGYNLLYLGRICYAKNLPFLMQLFYELLQYDDRYRLHVVGGISDVELFYFKENFINKIPCIDIDKNIIFHGQVEHSKISDIMAEMNYIVSSSIMEAQPVSIIEAMCCGLRPVVYSFGGAEEFLKPEYLFMTRADFLNRILENDCNPREYHECAIKNFSISENLWKYVKAIEGE